MQNFRQQVYKIAGDHMFFSRHHMYREAGRTFRFGVYQFLWKTWVVFAIATVFDAVLWLRTTSGTSFLWYPLIASCFAFSWDTLTSGFKNLIFGVAAIAILSLMATSAINSWLFVVDHLSLLVVTCTSYIMWHAEESTKRTAVLNVLGGNRDL